MVCPLWPSWRNGCIFHAHTVHNNSPNKSQTSAHQTCPSVLLSTKGSISTESPVGLCRNVGSRQWFSSHLSCAFTGAFEVSRNKQGLCVSLLSEPTLGPWSHQLLIKCLVISVSTFRSCSLCKHLERISFQASVTYLFCGSRESCVLGDVVALNEPSLWCLTVKGPLVNINRQRKQCHSTPIRQEEYSEQDLHAEKEREIMKMR